MADTKKFERLIIKGLLKGFDTRKLMDMLTKDFFETVQMRVIFGVIQDYYNKFTEVPQVDVLINELGKRGKDKAEFKHMEAFLTKKDDVTEDKFQYAVEEIEREFLARSLRNTMKKAVSYIEKGNPKKAQEVLSKDTTVLTTAGQEVKILDFSTGFEQRKEALVRRKEHPELFREFYVPTGVEKLDLELDGGLRKGELGLFLAPPESGKSISLQDLSMSATLAGFKVALFTIEMTAEQTAYRLDSRLTQIRYRKFRRADMREDDLNIWGEHMSKIKPNTLKIISVLEGCSCKLIEAEVSKMSGTFQPDIIAVDYAGIMSPNSGRFETSLDWKYVGAIVRDLKGLALKLNIPVWSASQMLVGAKEKAEVKFVDVGLARQQIAAHADICVAVIQTTQMQAMDVVKLQLVKVREGCNNRFIEIAPDYDRISLERKTVRVEDEEDEKV